MTLALVGLSLLILFGGQVDGCSIIGPEKAIAGTYFYEQRVGDPPPAVQSAIDTLNSKEGFAADIADVDVINKAGTIPKQYELTLPEAKRIGPPVWVTRSEKKVLKSVKAPKTVEEILETAP